MARSHQITINGNSFLARRGELLLDAALSNGINLPYECRAGHCGTCCVRLVSGEVRGGEGAEPGIVHACQCRIVGDAVIERGQPSGVRTIEGVLSSLRPLSPEVMEVGIRTNHALPYHAGQYAQVRFSGYPRRPFSITHPLSGNPNSGSVWFHVRRMKDGRVTSSLGKRIRPGHRVKLTGPLWLGAFPAQSGQPADSRRHQHRLCADLVDRRRCAAREPGAQDDDHRWRPHHPVALYGPGSRAAGPLPQCPRRACLQHAADLEQSGEAGPAD